MKQPPPEEEEKPHTCIVVEYNHRKVPAAMSIELVKGYNEPYKGPVFVYEYSHGANKKGFFRQRAASPSQIGRRRSPLTDTNASPIKQNTARTPYGESFPRVSEIPPAENPAHRGTFFERENSREEEFSGRDRRGSPTRRIERDRRSPDRRMDRDRWSPDRRLDRDRRSPDRRLDRDKERNRRNRERSPLDNLLRRDNRENSPLENSLRRDRDQSPDNDRRRNDTRDRYESSNRAPPLLDDKEKIASRLSDLETRLAEERKRYEEKSRLIEQKKIAIDDLLEFPGRKFRPERIVIFLRGPPCSGKSFLAKMIKDKEAQHGHAQNMRILSLDDYFMTNEVEREMVDERGLKKKVKAFEYEFDEELEEAYRQSLVKSFKKHINDAYFSFIIVDACNDQLSYYADMYVHAKGKGFAVFIAETTRDVSFCMSHNGHHRKEADIKEIVARFQATPKEQVIVDTTSLLQSAEIEDVEMEDVEMDENSQSNSNEVETVTLSDDDDGDIVELEDTSRFTIPSKWDNVDQNMGEFKAKLDGLRKPTKSLRDWLEEDADVDTSLYGTSEREKGKKRVRWADIEEKLKQDKMKAIGFIVGGTDWNRMMDPESGARQLNRTKYI